MFLAATAIRRVIMSAATAALSVVVLSGCVLEKNPFAKAAEGRVSNLKAATVQGNARLAAVQAVLARRCYECHMDFAKYVTDSAWLGAKGSFTSVPLVKAKDLANSALFTRLIGNGVSTANSTMPTAPYSELPAEERDTIKAWINGITATAPGAGVGQTTFDCNKTNADPTPALARRLSKEQYRNTVTDLLFARMNAGDASAVLGVISPLLDRVPADSGKDNSSQFQYASMDLNLGQEHADAYNEVAKTLAAQVTNSPDRRAAFGGNACMGSTGVSTDCRDGFLRSLGTQLLRRPILAGEELSDYQSIFSGPDGMRDSIQVMMMSPQFLFRLEDQGTPVPGRSDLFNLTQYELASRLSYTLWRTMPDATLFDLAGAGTLSANLAEQVDRMLSDSRARATLRQFYSEWLETQNLPDFTPNVNDAAYSAFAGANRPSGSFRQNVANEALDLLDFYTWSTDGKLADAFMSPYSFAKTSDLASVYGVSPWNGDTNSMVTFPAAAPRAGILTRTALVSTPSVDSRPIHIGVFIKKRILCDTLGPPAADAFGKKEPDLGPLATKRERTAALTQTPGTGCIGCHDQINPFGFALGDYDSLGRYRTQERIFYPSIANFTDVMIDAHSTMDLGVGGKIEVNGGVAASQAIVGSGKTEACFARNYLAYALGKREDVTADACVLETLRRKSVGDGSGIRQMIRALALDPSFKQKKRAN
jgi:hypothetical protein